MYTLLLSFSYFKYYFTYCSFLLLTVLYSEFSLVNDNFTFMNFKI